MTEFIDVNGKVIHAVARPPPSVRAQARGANNESPEVNRVNPRMDGSNVLVSTFTLPSEVVDPQQIQVNILALIINIAHYQ